MVQARFLATGESSVGRCALSGCLVLDPAYAALDGIVPDFDVLLGRTQLMSPQPAELPETASM